MPESAVVSAVAVKDVVASMPGDQAGAQGGRALWHALGREGLIEALYGWPDAGTAAESSRAASSRLLAGPVTTLMQALDSVAPVGVVLSVCPQLAVAIPVLGSGVASEIVREVWRSTVAGRMVTALAATDAGAAGSDLAALTTTLRLSGDEITVDGIKTWVTAGRFADHVLVLARHSAGEHITNFTWVLVPTAEPGVTVSVADTPLFSGAGLAHIRFEQVRLTHDHVVGRVGYGLPAFARHIATERFLGAIWATAMCRRVIADTHRLLQVRLLRGTPLWDNDVVRQRLARCAVEQRKLDALCAASLPEMHGPRAQATAMLLKVAAAETVDSVLTTCAHLHGADGFTADGQQFLRAQAAMFSIAGGATEPLLSVLADRMPELIGESGSCLPGATGTSSPRG